MRGSSTSPSLLYFCHGCRNKIQWPKVFLDDRMKYVHRSWASDGSQIEVDCGPASPMWDDGGTNRYWIGTLRRRQYDVE